jgi:hypothetical protein
VPFKRGVGCPSRSSALPTLVPTFRSQKWVGVDIMSSVLSDADITAAVSFISKERLGFFHNVATNDRDAIELHQISMSVSAALMPVVGLIEIAIRNSVCRELDKSFGSPGWLLSPPPPFVWKRDEERNLDKAQLSAKRAAYAKLSNSQKNALDATAFPNGVPTNIKHETHIKKRYQEIQVPDGQIVAQLTLYFWKRLFSKDYESTLWKRALKNIFPNKRLDRSDISEKLEHLYVCRNRIAHHEPVYGKRLTDTLIAIDFVSRNFHSVRPTVETPLAKLVDAHMPAVSQSAKAFADAIRRF